MKLRAIIVDDEAPGRANLKALLRRQADIELVAECDSGSTALDAIRRLRLPRAQTVPAPQRLVLKQAGQVLFLPVADIDWIGAADYYASLHVGAQTHLLRRSIAELAQDLDAATFCRIHRSTIINLAKLQSIEPDTDGEQEAVLTSGARLRVSRSYRKTLMERAAR